MLDDAGLRQSWYSALDAAQTNFRQHLVSHSASDWKRVNDPNSSSPTSPKGKGKASSVPQTSDVILHRKVTRSGNVYRAILDVALGEDNPISLDSCKSVLASPELRKEWDPAVESAQLLEMCDQATRIVKTNFTLGWPASPRDAVTISRMFSDTSILIDVSTSLPRSPDEPIYLRPSPPYVRSDVMLFAWCIQLIKLQPQDSQKPAGGILRMTCFWQHDLRAMWNLGSTSTFVQQLGAMMVGFYKAVKTRGPRIPVLTGYGNGVSIERVRFGSERDALTVEYSVVPEEEDHRAHTSDQGLEELHAIREHRRLTRSVECTLPSAEGWDVQLSTRASSDEVSTLPWTAHCTYGSSNDNEEEDKIIFRITHSPLPNDHSVLKVSVVIELSAPSSGLRLNGIPQTIERLEERDPSSYYMSSQMLQDAISTANLSFRTQTTFNTVTSASSTSTVPEKPTLTPVNAERTAAGDKAILSRVKRNYIYFSSLLQEPEAKWKRTTEARGVSVAQLDSIDPTLVVYRAEATFVGLSLWDLYAAVATPGARAYWDKLYDDAVLIEDVNQLTELWHFKTKPAWPVNGRDSVVLKTVYKSPTTIHVFAFSADDPNLFPHIPPVDPNIIRTQVDLQGWAIEALSPTTTLLTLLEQSDPKGWTGKTSIPQQMIAAVTGIGDFAIKFGGPPVATRLEGAKANDIRYDHERGSFRIEYEGSPSRRSSSDSKSAEGPVSPAMPVIECELRCDLDSWATSLDVVVDPPPQSIVCLRRHRLSSAGGGLWVTICHDAVHANDERLLVIVRRAPQGVAKEKGMVMINGAKVDVDVEELPEKEAKTLAKKKRIKPVRIPLDQPPVLGAIRRRNAEWADPDGSESPDKENNGNEAAISPTSSTFTTTSPQFVTTWTRYFNYAVEQATTTTQQAVAAISPASGVDSVPSSSKAPMQYALDALSYLQTLHTRPTSEGWTLVSDKDFPVYRKLSEEISPVIPVHKGEKVIEGVSAEEVASVLTSYDCRKQWDTRFDSVSIFESFGGQAHTAFVVSKGGFPFRDRGFYLANLVVKLTIPSTSSSRRNLADSEPQSDSRTAIFCVSASFSPQSVSSFSHTKYNSYGLPVGRVYVDGWILETLDPYATENYAIPSTRCTRVVAADYGGSIPAAVNSMINGMLPKSILAVETYVKSISPPPFMRMPAAGMAASSKFDDEATDQSWTLRRRDSSRMLVVTRYHPGDRVFHSVMVLNPTGVNSTGSSQPLSDRTPRPSKIVRSPRTPSPPEDGRAAQSSDASSSTTSSSVDRPVNGSARSRSRDALRSPSMFTVRGEVRHPTDLLVAELVVDSKLYPEGYQVKVGSRLDKSVGRLALPPSGQSVSSDNPLPIVYAVYTLPPSPNHSSGLNTDRAPRHLLRLTLPTAQYQVSTIQDPLTGETRTAPPKPQWLLDMEEGRAVIDIEIKAASSGTDGKAKSVAVMVDGSPAKILSEKESLTNIGRDELLDGRTSKMDLLLKGASEAEQPPKELQEPLAIAEYLLDESAQVSVAPTPPESPETQDANTPADNREDSVESHSQEVLAPNENRPGDSSGSGLLRFLNSYPNPLFRFSSTSSRTQAVVPASSKSALSTFRQSRGEKGPGLGDENARVSLLPPKDVATKTTGMYPLSTLIIVTLIAFLLGSLLRSLISPADFIYVVSDLKDVNEFSSGWREIKRLVEVKYIVGGWDFQIAVVRRH